MACRDSCDPPVSSRLPRSSLFSLAPSLSASASVSFPVRHEELRSVLRDIEILKEGASNAADTGYLCLSAFSTTFSYCLPNPRFLLFDPILGQSAIHHSRCIHTTHAAAHSLHRDIARPSISIQLDLDLASRQHEPQLNLIINHHKRDLSIHLIIIQPSSSRQPHLSQLSHRWPCTSANNLTQPRLPKLPLLG